ncbi:MAG: MFS transporter [Spirochaetota bacterium]
MPALAFATNFLWVMVIGLLGPNLPAMVTDLGISYAQAGFFFTLLSLGSLVGTSVGGIGSDFLPRKLLYGSCVLLLSLGLLVMGIAPGYILIASCVFFLSLFGSPIGAIGQSIMLGMFPTKREKYLSLFTLFGAMGSLLAPIFVSVNFIFSLSWRWAFVEAACIGFLVLVALLTVRIPPLAANHQKVGLSEIARHRGIVVVAILIFFSTGSDFGFSYWLAEYFKTELHASLRLSSSVVGVYLIGIIAGRSLINVFLRRMSPRAITISGLCVSLGSIVPFILVPSIPLKVAFCFLYGFGTAPVFPLLVARGTKLFPAQPGAVTGILYGCLSLGGMVFPFLVGILAGNFGIAASYFFCALVVAGLLIAVLLGKAPRIGPEASASA